jgi:hypothetical protein
VARLEALGFVLDQKLREAGIDSLQVIHDYVEDPNLSYLV